MKKIQHSVVDHEIWRISFEIWQISWNLVDFMARTYIHEIRQISWLGGISGKPRTYTLHLYLYWISWMKKIQHSVVDHEIQQISCEIWQISWNPVQISWQGLIYTTYLACNRLIHVYLYWFCRKIQQNPLFMKSGRFHGEIQQISWWNPADFMMKSGRFHDEFQVDFMKSGKFHEIRRISWLILKNANLKV